MLEVIVGLVILGVVFFGISRLINKGDIVHRIDNNPYNYKRKLKKNDSN